MNKKAIKTLRVLSVEQIDKAKSGHPGMALGAAPTMHTLYTKIMNVNPKNDKWINRDRFVLSAGHGSALLYSLLHLSGFGIMLTDLKRFRQYQSITPGHPEYGLTSGIDSTSGPLGQGISIAVGMAIAEEYLRARFNKPSFDLINHYTYVLCGDGDLQEGIAQEAISLAGTLKLSRLIVLYDSNDIQLDGEVNEVNTENVSAKFTAMGWDYAYVDNGEDIEKIETEILKAKENQKPTLIEIKTIIGHGSKMANTHQVHGSPLPNEEVKAMREELGGNPFEVEEDVYDYYHKAVMKRGETQYNDWLKLYNSYKKEYPKEFELFEKVINDNFNIEFENLITINPEDKNATRVYGGKIIEALSKKHQGLLAGSADLSSSTKIKGNDGNFNKKNRLGRNINYGVREHAMGAISNGIILHSLRSVVSTFFVFSDYMKPAIRMAALMELPAIFVFSHDSIAVGEDGPTHQPIEQLTMLRSIPNLITIRPADGYETLYAWKVALETKDAPTAIILSRQNLPTLTNHKQAMQLEKGAYVLSYENKRLDGIIIASGSELNLAIKAQHDLLSKGYDVRVVSIPSTSLFERQPLEYRESIIPSDSETKIAIEMGEASHLYKYIGSKGKLINIQSFGASGPGGEVIDVYGFTVENIINEFLKLKG